MRSILCVIDFSSSSDRVLEMAASIAMEHRVKLVILFAYRLIDHNGAADIQQFKKAMELQAAEKFAQLEARFLKPLRNLNYDFFAEIGFVTDRILFHLNKNSIDSIVISNLDAIAHDNRKNFLKELLKSKGVTLITIPSFESSNVDL